MRRENGTRTVSVVDPPQFPNELPKSGAVAGRKPHLIDFVKLLEKIQRGDWRKEWETFAVVLPLFASARQRRPASSDSADCRESALVGVCVRLSPLADFLFRMALDMVLDAAIL